MTEIDTLLVRIAALEARVAYLESRGIGAWPQPLQPISPPFLPNGPWPVYCTDGLGNVSEMPTGTTYNSPIDMRAS